MNRKGARSGTGDRRRDPVLRVHARQWRGCDVLNASSRSLGTPEPKPGPCPLGAGDGERARGGLAGPAGAAMVPLLRGTARAMCPAEPIACSGVLCTMSRYPSRPSPLRPPVEFPVDDGGLVAFARQLAKTPSVSSNEALAVEAAADQMRLLGFDSVEVDDVGNCTGVIGSGKAPRLLIDGHVDSIPLHSSERWTIDPFGACVVDGRLYGLGVCDQKASVAAAIFGVAAARRALGELFGTVAVVASVNEEDMEGAALQSVAERFEPTFAITSEPSGTRLCIGHRGRARVAATVTGRPCHAGYASLGVNAAEALAALVSEVRGLAHPTHLRLGRRDITCIDMTSWPYPSLATVPGRALARFDARLLPDETPESLLATIEHAAQRAWTGWDEQPGFEVAIVLAEFKTWTGRAFSVPEFSAAWWTDEASPFVTRAARALASQGLDPTPTYYTFCTNGSYLAGQAGIPTIGFGVGEGHMAHQVDEHVTLESLTKGAKGFAAIAAELLGGR